MPSSSRPVRSPIGCETRRYEAWLADLLTRLFLD
jgi:hypothetical protein